MILSPLAFSDWLESSFSDKKSDNQKRPLLSVRMDQMRERWKKIDGRVESFSDRRERRSESARTKMNSILIQWTIDS